MTELFEFLYNLLQGSLYLAFLGAFLWGVASIVLSPCHLASIPLIVGYINGQRDYTNRKAFLLSLIFSLGILLTFILVGFITSLAGRLIGDLGSFGKYFLSGFLILFGLVLLDLIKLPQISFFRPSTNLRHGLIAVFGIGIAFGTGVGPCTFAFLAPILGIVFNLGSKDWFFSLMLFFFFSAGHITIIILAGTFSNKVQKLLHWNESSRTINILRMVCGILLIIAGIYNAVS